MLLPVIDTKRFFFQNQKFTYFWQFCTVSQSTSSEMTCLIQHLMTATWWHPHRCWWRQKRIMHTWQKVGPHISLHFVRCSLPNPNSFLDIAWPCIALLTKNFGILPLSVTCVWSSSDIISIREDATKWRSSAVGSSKSFLRKYSDQEYETVKSELLVLEEESVCIYTTTNLMNLYKDTSYYC